MVVMQDEHHFLTLLNPIVPKDIEGASREPDAYRHDYDQPLEIEQAHQASVTVSEEDLVTPHQQSPADMMSIFDESDHSAAAELELPKHQLPVRGAQPGPILVDDRESSIEDSEEEEEEVVGDDARLGRGMANPLHPLQAAQRRPEITQFIVGQDFEFSAGRFQAFDCDDHEPVFSTHGTHLLSFRRGDFRDAPTG